MKVLKKIFYCTFATLFAILPLSSCKKDDGVKTIKLNEVTHSIFYAPTYLAEALGYFEEENIKIELTNGGGADNVMASVLSGDAEIGFCGPEAALYVLIGGSSDVPTVIGQLTNGMGLSLFPVHPNPISSGRTSKAKKSSQGAKAAYPP